METELGQSTTEPSPNPSSSSSNSNDAGDFECNICFELPQDPIVTLCGHLFCWLCLYKWLHHHSHSQECPVCKALVEEDKVVPLYGRGKSPADPRSKSYPPFDIPNHTASQRPETASPPLSNNIQFHGFSDATVYGGHALGFHRLQSRGEQADNFLKNLLLLIAVLVILALICW